MQLADLISCHPSEAINSSWDTEVGERKKKKKIGKNKIRNPKQTKIENRTLSQNMTFNK